NNLWTAAAVFFASETGSAFTGARRGQKQERRKSAAVQILRWATRLSRDAQVARKPLTGQVGDLFESARLGEQVRAAGHNDQVFRTAQSVEGFAIEIHDHTIVAADDESGGRAHGGQLVPGQVRSPTARDDRADPVGLPRRGDQGGRSAGAGAEIAQPQI